MGVEARDAVDAAGLVARKHAGTEVQQVTQPAKVHEELIAARPGEDLGQAVDVIDAGDEAGPLAVTVGEGEGPRVVRNLEQARPDPRDRGCGHAVAGRPDDLVYG